MLLLAWLACAPEVPEPPPPPEPAPASREVVPHMQEHLDSADAARDAVIAGDLAAVRAPLSFLARHVGPAVPAPLEAGERAVKAAAGRPVDDLPSAGQAVAGVGAACGSCHTATGKGPRFEGELLPPGDDAKGRMARHRWSVDRMWEGLVSDDPARFQAGAFALVEPAFPGDAPPEARALADRLATLGQAGVEGLDRDGRAALYGQVIATCAGCHTTTGGGPGVVP